jgi:hypothetical protein
MQNTCRVLRFFFYITLYAYATDINLQFGVRTPEVNCLSLGFFAATRKDDNLAPNKRICSDMRRSNSPPV